MKRHYQKLSVESIGVEAGKPFLVGGSATIAIKQDVTVEDFDNGGDFTIGF